MTYEAPDITAVSDVAAPLIGTTGSTVYSNPQWNDDAE